MNDRCVSLLDNYDVEVLRTTKGRGAILCETNQGMLIFKEYPKDLPIEIKDDMVKDMNEMIRWLNEK